MNINRLFKDFEKLKVLVLGDIMVDAYFYGSVKRISPEAPVPIVNLKSKERRLGGAANVALNIKALGAQPIICSIKGNDKDGKRLKELLIENKLDSDCLFNDYKRSTTVKTRIIGNNHQLLRIDEEETQDIDKTLEDLIFNSIKEMISEIDVLIFQDYNKGLLTASLISRVIGLCKKKKVPIVVDPKFDNFFEYKGVTLFKPNKKELMQSENINGSIKLKDVKKLASNLREKLGADKVMTTLSQDGIFIVDQNNAIHLPAHARKIVDVSGAGDSVLSVAALCVAAGVNNEVTAALSNLAGGIVCEAVGVVPIDKDTLITEATELNVSERY
jgi:rfaE bifunctional protein kinase chain/domain